MRRPKTWRERIETRIARKRAEDVFLTREFRDLGGEDQVLRALRTSRPRKKPRSLGYGVYGRAVVSRLSGHPILYSKTGFWRGTASVYQARGEMGALRSRTRLQRGAFGTDCA